MPDDLISRNEFNGFTTTVREEFKRFGDQLTIVSGKLDMLVNGLALTLFSGWTKAFFRTPPVTNPVINGLSANSSDFGPFGNTRSLTSSHYKNIVPSVSSLFGVSCPSAIARAISIIAINPVNRMLG